MSMKSSKRTTSIILVVYCIVTIFFLVWINAQLRKGMQFVAEDTAVLIGDQVKVLLKDQISNVNKGKKNILDDLNESISTAERQSVVINDIEVVSYNGSVLVDDSDDKPEKKRDHYEHVFADKQHTFILDSNKSSKNNDHDLIVVIPLFEASKPQGYLRVVMRNKPIEELSDQIYYFILLAAAAGLFLIIGIGISIDYQFVKFSKGLVKVLENAASGNKNDDDYNESSELFSVHKAAKSLGDKLAEAQKDVTAKRDEFDQFAKLTQMGLLLIDSHYELDFVSETAKSLLTAGNIEVFDDAYSSVKDRLKAAINKIQSSDELRQQFVLDLEQGGFIKSLQFEIYPIKQSAQSGYLALVRDHDAIEALDSDLRAATQSRNLARLYLGIAHDLKAPLNNMDMNLIALKSKLQGKGDHDPTDPITYLTILEEEVHRLNRLLLLLLSQAEPGTVSRENININTLLKDMLKLIDSQRSSQNIRLTTTFSDGLPDVSGIYTQLQQALLNIMINALDAMPRGGKLDVVTKTESHEVKIFINDTGPGIPTALQSKIFNMHFTTKSTGTGIGLYVAKRVIEQHKGRLKVDTTLGKGSSFQVFLPAADIN